MGIVKGYICPFSSKYGNFWLEATNSKAEASKHRVKINGWCQCQSQSIFKLSADQKRHEMPLGPYLGIYFEVLLNLNLF